MAKEVFNESRIPRARISESIGDAGPAEHLGLEIHPAGALRQKAVNEQFHQVHPIATRCAPGHVRRPRPLREQKVVHASQTVSNVKQAGRDTGPKRGGHHQVGLIADAILTLHDWTHARDMLHENLPTTFSIQAFRLIVVKGLAR